VDLFFLENDLSAGIASAIVTHLGIQNRPSRPRPASMNPQIREAYLRGRYHYNKRTEEGLNKSIGYYKQAIERDPSFVLAYTGLAESYIALESWGVLCGNDALPLISSAAMESLNLESGLA
jgi:hypothetical protein